MNAKAPILEVSGLHTYYGASHILHGVDFAVHRGEAISFMGRNGMGKTTTIRSIFGLTPPRRGEVRIFGEDATGASPHVIARNGFALVPEGRGIFPNLSVAENLIMAARAGQNGSMAWTLERVLETFPRLAERLRSLGDHLSGGEQQMLSIGRALMTNPDLLLLDEPTEGLAPLIVEIVLEIIESIKNEGLTIILVEQNVAATKKVADRYYVLQEGCVVYHGSNEEFWSKPELQEKYLGV